MYLLSVFLFVLRSWLVLNQIPAILAVQVTDQLGAGIPAAQVLLISKADGEVKKSATTDSRGFFEFGNLMPGTYTVRVSKDGFAVADHNIEIVSGSRRQLNIQLQIVLTPPEVSVGDDENLALDRNRSAATSLGEREIASLPDDPAELEAALRSLAGVPVGPNGGQIMIDGFENTNQPLPNRNNIREVRINQNPFSAENDRIGFGQIQIITRPGSEKWNGSAYFTFNDESLNSRNPFTARRSPYQSRQYGGNFSGPLSPKRASLTFYIDRRETDDNVLINATTLDPDLNVRRVSSVAIIPRKQINVAGALNLQLSENHTLGTRYAYFRSGGDGYGIGGFALPERAYSLSMPIQTIQFTETAVFAKKYVNEFRLQNIRENRLDNDANENPTISVLGAFDGGGAGIGLARNPETRLTMQDSLLWTKGNHVLRIGLRVRHTSIIDVSPNFFNGRFVFGGGEAPRLDQNGEILRDSAGQIILESINGLERFRRTLFLRQHGLDPATIRARGGGATQFSRAGGNPEATARQVDAGGYIQDDWRVAPSFSIALGLRFETQSNVQARLNLAPRLSFAWSPSFANKDVQKPVTIIRGGFGIFFDRFNENQVLISNRSQQNDYFQFVTSNTEFLDGFPVPPTVQQLQQQLGPSGQTKWRMANDLRVPYMLQAALSVERQLPKKTTLSVTLITARTLHSLRSRNINAPIVVRDEEGNVLSAIRPTSTEGDIFQFESSGRSVQNQLVIGVNNRLSDHISFFASYTLNSANSDTDNVNMLPADSYNLAGEYGRSETDVRHTFSAGGNFELPLKIRISPLVFAASGRPFNITTGIDANFDSAYTDRPAFVTDLSRPSVVHTAFGSFDLNPTATQTVIPRNYGTSASFFSANINLSREFRFGGATGANKNDKAYKLLLAVRAINLFNRTNFGNPVGILTSPSFGQSLSTSGGFSGFSTGNPAAGNRRFEAQIRFSF